MYVCWLILASVFVLLVAVGNLSFAALAATGGALLSFGLAGLLPFRVYRERERDPQASLSRGAAVLAIGLGAVGLVLIFWSSYL
jgi:hypothetical protein